MHWWRILIGGVASEVRVIVALLTSIAIYKARTPGLSREQTQTLGERLGYYVAPPAGFVTTGLAALLAVRGGEANVVAHGMLVGVVSVAITSPFFFGAKPEHRAMYGVAFALRLAAGYLAGALAAGSLL